MDNVKGLNPGPFQWQVAEFDRSRECSPECSFLHRKISCHVCCFPGFHVTLAHARFDLRCHVRLLNQQNELPLNSSNSRGLHKQHRVANRVVLLFSDNRKPVFLQPASKLSYLGKRSEPRENARSRGLVRRLPSSFKKKVRLCIGGITLLECGGGFCWLLCRGLHIHKPLKSRQFLAMLAFSQYRTSILAGRFRLPIFRAKLQSPGPSTFFRELFWSCHFEAVQFRAKVKLPPTGCLVKHFFNHMFRCDVNCFYFKLSLTKHYLNMFKRWCERGISLRILQTTYQRLTLESWFTNLE